MQVLPIIAVLALFAILAQRREGPVDAPGFIWPIEPSEIKRVGQSTMVDRDGTGRAHHGLDIFANSGTKVRAAAAGKVIRVVDGRASDRETSRAAGLWVDISINGGLVLRYLHLGSVTIKEGQSVSSGEVLGTIASPNTSGLGNDPHLHFEVRLSDYSHLRQAYGQSRDPLAYLPVSPGKAERYGSSV